MELTERTVYQLNLTREEVEDLFHELVDLQRFGIPVGTHRFKELEHLGRILTRELDTPKHPGGY